MFALLSCESKITKSIFHIRLSKAGGVLDLSLFSIGGLVGEERPLALLLSSWSRKSKVTVTTRESKSRCKLIT